MNNWICVVHNFHSQRVVMLHNLCAGKNNKTKTFRTFKQLVASTSQSLNLTISNV